MLTISFIMAIAAVTISHLYITCTINCNTSRRSKCPSRNSNGLAPSGSMHSCPILVLQYDHVSNVMLKKENLLLLQLQQIEQIS
jgi:hypothetical protein